MASGEGVPRKSVMMSNWWTTFFPGKRGFPVKSSAKMQPMLQMSIAGVYCIQITVATFSWHQSNYHNLICMHNMMLYDNSSQHLTDTGDRGHIYYLREEGSTQFRSSVPSCCNIILSRYKIWSGKIISTHQFPHYSSIKKKLSIAICV